MSYQVNINQNTTSSGVYIGRKEDLLNPIAVNAEDNQVSEVAKQMEQMMNSDVEPATTTQVLKNTEQYMELLEKNGVTNSSSDEPTEEEQRKEMREIYKSLTPDEIAKLKMMNIDISSVELSDIMGLVTSIRSAENQAEFNQKLANICDGIDSVKGKVNHETLKQALASIMPEDMDNVKLNHLIDQDFQIDEQQTIYLMKNQLELTINNLYKAEFATTAKGSGETTSLADKDFEAMLPKFKELIEKAGLSQEDEAFMLSGIRKLIENEAPVSVGNLRNMVAIQDINQNGVVTDKLVANILEQKTFGLSVEGANVYYETLTERAENFIENIEARAERLMDGMSQADITARRQLEEIRLTLTQEAATKMVMKNMHIDTSELSEIVRMLRDTEAQMAEETLQAYHVELSKENISLYQETMHKVAGVRNMPAAALAIATREELFTVNALYEEGIRQSAKQAVAHYETMMTAPRKDMGDSINKAFANMDSLLKEMGIDDTQANKRAVRILGYNQMEITEESIRQIKVADAKVQTMLKDMTPQAVVKLIRENQNPLNMPIDELNHILEQNQGDIQIKEAERYSEYLYRLQQKGDISEAEKQSYIGIFRLLHKVSKFSGRDIGTVVNNGQDLTLANLLTAHRSNQAKGMELTASDDNGMLSSVTSRGISISEQIETAFHYEEQLVQDILENISPEGIDEAGGIDSFMQMGLEQSREAIQDTKSQSISKSYSEAVDEYSVLQDTDEAMQSMMEQYDIPYTASNTQVMHMMQTNTLGAFSLISDIYKKINNDKKDEKLQDLFASVEENFTDSESIQEAYQDMGNQINEMADIAISESVLTYRDIQSMKQIHTAMSIMQKMGQQESYQVPVELEDGWAMMNVQFLNADSNQQGGRIACSMKHPVYGELQAELVTGEDAEGSLFSTTQGEMRLADDILERAKDADTRSKQYALAKEMIRVFATL